MKTTSKNEVLEKMLPKQDLADKRPSVYSNTITSVDDLLKNIELRDRCKRILGFGHDDLTPDHFYEYEADERDEEVVRLLEDLGMLKADWAGFKKQPLGIRKMRIAVDNNSVINFFDRLNGKNTKINKATLKLVAHQLADDRDADDFFELLENCGVPKTLFQYDESYPINNEWRIAYDILKLYSSSPDQKDLEVVFQIIEKLTLPIMFDGDAKKSLEFINKLNSYLQHDGYCFENEKVVKASDDLLKKIGTKKYKFSQTDTASEEIKNIIAVTKTQQTKPLIVINKHYSEAITIVDSSSKNIKALLEAIENGTDVLKSEDLVQCRDYLNSNANCRLYKSKDGLRQVYKLTEIVRFDDPYKRDRKLEISKKVSTRKITNQDYKRNLAKEKNKIGT